MVVSNQIEVGAEAPVTQSYFKVREQSLHGDCQTIYNIHPLASYQALEIEEELETVEKQRSLKEHLQGGLSQGRDICQGKKYWQITKTRDFNNCVERPVFQKWSGFSARECDATKDNCGDLMTVSFSNDFKAISFISLILNFLSMTQNILVNLHRKNQLLWAN